MPVSGVQVSVPEQKEYELLPKDVYQAQLLDIENKQETAWQSTELVDKIVFTFVIIEEGEFYGRRMWQHCTTKLSKFKGGSNLYKVLVGMNDGKDFTDAQIASPEEIAGDDALNALINKQVRISVGVTEKQTKKGEFKNVIESFMPVKSQLPEFVAKEDGESTNAPKPVVTTEDGEEVADITFEE